MRLPEGIRRLFRLGLVRPQVSRDLDDELDFHFDEAVRDLLDRGLTEAEAREEARARFGDERAYRRTLERIDEARVRTTERSALLDTVARTLALTLRRIRRAPAFTTSVVVILTLGIGANAVMFGVVDRVLLSPPQHIVDADELHGLHVRGMASVFTREIVLHQGFSYPEYEDLFAVDAFTDVAAYALSRELTVGRGEAAGRARVVGTSANLFPLLGVQPAVGRFFPLEEDARAANPIAVLADEYWGRRFGRDPDILGQTIEVDTRSLTVIGIAPAGFTGAQIAPVDIWMPISELFYSRPSQFTNRVGRGLRVVARLAPAATVEAAEAEATARHRSGNALDIAQGYYNADAEILLAPIIAARGPNPTSEVEVAQWLAGVSLVILLIACFNVANLLLARSIRTRREIAVRLALGSSRGRLIGCPCVASAVRRASRLSRS